MEANGSDRTEAESWSFCVIRNWNERNRMKQVPLFKDSSKDGKDEALHRCQSPVRDSMLACLQEQITE